MTTEPTQAELDADAIREIARMAEVPEATLTESARIPGRVEGEPLAAAVAYMTDAGLWTDDDWLEMLDCTAYRYGRVIVSVDSVGFHSARAFPTESDAVAWLDGHDAYLNGDLHND